MKLAKTLAILMVLSLALFACKGGGGDEDDASQQCENLCERLDDCVEGFPEGDCRDFCDEVDDEESDLSNSCEEAVAGIFGCIADFACIEIEELAELEIEGIEDFAIFAEEQCEDEVADLIDDCDIDIE